MSRLLPLPGVLLVTLGLVSSLPAQSTSVTVPVFNWTTLAGRASVGHEDGPAVQARFNHPHGLARDQAGNLYVTDKLNHTLRKITPEGTVSTLAGSPGQIGSADGTGTTARFNTPKGLAIDGTGNLYVADTLNHVVRKITPAGVVTTLAGQPGKPGHTDGPAASALFTSVEQIGADSNGNVYLFDPDKGIRKISGGNVTTFYSGGTLTDAGGRSFTVELQDSLTVTAAGDVYCVAKATPWNGPGLCILKLDAAGNATFQLPPATFGAEGSSNPVDSIRGLSPDGTGGFYFSLSQRVYYGHESVLARWNQTGLDWIRALTDRHNLDVHALSISFGTSGTVLYTTDDDNSVRTLGSFTAYAGTAHPVAPADGAGTAARFSSLTALAVDPNGNVWAGDDAYRRIADDIVGEAYLRKIAPDGTTSTPYTSSYGFNPPIYAQSVAADGKGNVFYGEHVYYQVLRRFASSGTVTTLPDLEPTTNYLTTYSAASPDGILAVIESRGVVNKWDPVTGQWSVLAGSRVQGEPGVERKDGTGTAAVLGYLNAIAADRQGNFYVLDSNSTTSTLSSTCLIRKITPAGVVTTVSNNVIIRGPSNTPGQPPLALAVDSAGRFYLLYWDHTVRILTSDGPAQVGGSPWIEGHEDGRGTAARFGFASALAIDAQDNLYVVDGAGAAIRKGQYLGVEPAITSQPMGGAFAAGSAVTISVTASGTPAPTFQWYRDGAIVAGATGTSLALSNLSSANTGSYKVVVTNAAGSVTSEAAVVSLRTTTPPPPAGGGGNSGGGGGAPSLWFLTALLTLAAARRFQRR